MAQKQEVLKKKAAQGAAQERMKELLEFVEGQGERVDEYDEQLVRRLVERILVFDDKLDVEFKAGVVVSV